MSVDTFDTMNRQNEREYSNINDWLNQKGTIYLCFCEQKLKKKLIRVQEKQKQHLSPKYQATSSSQFELFPSLQDVAYHATNIASLIELALK